MNALRWMLGIIAAVFGGGFVVLVVLANAFRSSFGATEHGPWFIGPPVVASGLLLAAILYPSSKPLLHSAALAALGLASVCLWLILAQGETSLWFALVYLATWFLYYGLAVGRDLSGS